MSEPTTTATADAADRAQTILWAFSSFGVTAPNRRLAALISHLRSYNHAIIALDGEWGAESLLSPSARWRRVKTGARRRGIAALGDLWGARKVLAEQRPALLATVGLGAINWLAVNRGPGAAPLIHFQHPVGPEEALEGADGRGDWTRRQAFSGKGRLYIAEDPETARIMTSSWGAPDAAVRRVAWPVDLGLVRPVDRSGRSRVTFGALTPLTAERRHDRLLRILASLVERGRDVGARFVGQGPERAKLQALAETLEIAERVSFVDQDGYDPAVAAAETRTMDVYADLPDRARCSAGPALASAAGLPILGAQVGAVADAAADLNTLFIRPAEDESALAAAAELLTADEALRRRLGAGNRAHATAIHSESVVMAQYDAWIEEAMGATTRLALPAPDGASIGAETVAYAPPPPPPAPRAPTPVALTDTTPAPRPPVPQPPAPKPPSPEEPTAKRSPARPSEPAAQEPSLPALAPAAPDAVSEAPAPKKVAPKSNRRRSRKKPAATQAESEPADPAPAPAPNAATPPEATATETNSAGPSALAGLIAGGVAAEALRQARHADEHDGAESAGAPTDASGAAPRKEAE